jgi:hypothetical protein
MSKMLFIPCSMLINKKKQKDTQRSTRNMSDLITYNL